MENNVAPPRSAQRGATSADEDMAGDGQLGPLSKDIKPTLKLPNLDWGTLESKFQDSTFTELQHQPPLSRKTSDERREETLRKLAMSSHDQDYASLYRRPSKGKAAQGSLELCVMNELDEGSSSADLRTPPEECPAFTVEPLGGAGLAVSQEQLRDEATRAFAKARDIAQALLEAEKQNSQRPSSLAEVIGMVKPGGATERLGRKELEPMNLARLQVLFNALKNEVEAYNEDLVRLLLERDELCMRKDSLLVDVEDLQQRVKELKHRAGT